MFILRQNHLHLLILTMLDVKKIYVVVGSKHIIAMTIRTFFLRFSELPFLFFKELYLNSELVLYLPLYLHHMHLFINKNKCLKQFASLYSIQNLCISLIRFTLCNKLVIPQKCIDISFRILKHNYYILCRLRID
jgi:hypothetical protein